MYITPRQKRRYVITTIILAIALPLTVLAAYFVTQLVSNANAEAIPEDVIISNLTSRSITISWKTDVPADGTVLVSGPSGETPFEEKRTRGGERNTHYVEITDLSPDSEYSFEIVSNGRSYASQSGVNFTFATLPLVDAAPVPNPVYGELPVDDDDYVVYLVAVGADIPASTVINSSSNWIVDLSNIKTNDGNVFAVSDTTQLKLVVFSEGEMGALFSGSYIEMFDDAGQLLGDIDLTITDIPNLIAEIPETARVGEVVAGTTDSDNDGGGNDDSGDPTGGENTGNGDTGGTPTTGNNGGVVTGGDFGTGGNANTGTIGNNSTTSGNTDTNSNTTTGTNTDTTTSTTTDGNSGVPIIPPSTFDPASREFIAGVTAINWTNLSQSVPTAQAPDVLVGQSSIVKSNLTDNNITINWVTADKISGYVMYGTSADALTSEAKDVRDVGATKGTYNVHSVALKNLTPDTTYYYEIHSGSEIFKDGTTPYQQTTFETLSSPPQGTSAQGSVNGVTSYSDMIVLVEIEDIDGSGSENTSTVVSTTVDTSGNWLIGIGDARNSIGSEYFEFSTSDQLNVSLLAYAESEIVDTPAADLETKDITLQATIPTAGGGGFQKFSPLADYGVINPVYVLNGSSVAAAAIQNPTTSQGGAGNATTTGNSTVDYGTGDITTPKTGLLDNKFFIIISAGVLSLIVAVLIWFIVSQGKPVDKRNTMGRNLV